MGIRTSFGVVFDQVLFVFFLHFENTNMSPRTEKTLDCGWESKVGLQKLVFKSLSSKVGLQKINVVLPMNKLVILKTKHSILNKCQHVLNKKLCPQNMI